MRPLVGSLACLLLWTWCFQARASDPAEKKKEAQAIFVQGQKHYRLGRFQKALEAYSKAYEIMPLAGLLFNIGQCHRMLGNYERAVFFYRSYLREAPQAKNRKAVETLLAKCEKKLEEQRRLEQEKLAAEQKAAEESRQSEEERLRVEQQLALERARAEAAEAEAAARAAEAAAAERRSGAFYKSWWFWTIVGVAVAGAAAGTYFAVRPAPGAVNPSGSLGTIVW